jgi:hypothetical protein
MTIKVVWLTYHKEVPANDYWDMTMLKDLFRGKMWDPVEGFEFEEMFHLNEIPVGEGAIIVIPGRYHNLDIDLINKDISILPWVIMMIVGDEESIFPTDRLQHPHMRLWVMTPIPGRHKADHFLPHGYTPYTRIYLSAYGNDEIRPYRWFFSGQITHSRRDACAEVLENRNDGKFYRTPGFTQGLSGSEYYSRMAMSKVIPCPSGPATPDSFRVVEALEAGCVPIADDCTPDPNYPSGYWSFIFKETPPFAIIRDWESFPGYTKEIIDEWPGSANKVFSWWQGYKRKMAYDVVDDLEKLGIRSGMRHIDRDLVTVLIPTSPIPSHPDTSIIEETISSVRKCLPSCEIILMIDGIREDQEHYRAAYAEYTRRLLWKCSFEWKNILPVVYREHLHQAAMTRNCLDKVRTPMILFVEHDTPIVTDRFIDWTNLFEVVLQGHVDMVRLHYNYCINEEHWPMMLDRSKPFEVCGVRLIRTFQWSQRPHIASTSFYRRIIQDKFTPDSRTMIEDRMHGIVEENYRHNPQTGWNNYRLAIYMPNDDNIQRSLHLNGRMADSKFEDKFKF